jgi:hypothetical protein
MKSVEIEIYRDNNNNRTRKKIEKGVTKKNRTTVITKLFCASRKEK